MTKAILEYKGEWIEVGVRRMIPNPKHEEHKTRINCYRLIDRMFNTDDHEWDQLEQHKFLTIKEARIKSVRSLGSTKDL